MVRQTGNGAETGRWSSSGIDPDGLGKLFGKVAVGFWILAVLSLLATVGVLLAAADEPFVDEPHLEDPISGWVFVLSLAGAGLSMLGYTVWSIWMDRRRRAAATGPTEPSPFVRPLRLFAIVASDGDDLDRGEKRVQNAVLAVVLAILSLYLPVQIAWHALTA